MQVRVAQLLHFGYLHDSMCSAGGASGDDNAKAFYALGVNIASQVGPELKSLLTKEEIEHAVRGISDSLTGKCVDEVKLLTTWGQKSNEILQERVRKMADDRKKVGEEFRTKYLLSNPHAKVTKSGLIYHEVIAGIGKQAVESSTVVVHYQGSLTDGAVFDSSIARGEPIRFELANVIAGWKEGISLMREGGKATFVIPPELAYGEDGSPPVIPPAATLKFDVDLIKVE